MILLVFGQSTLVYGLSVLIAGLWWSRPSTRNSLMELSITPTSPYKYIKSALLPVKIIALGAVVASSFPLVFDWEGGGGVEGGTFFAAWLGNVPCVWLNIPMALALILRSHGMGGGIFKASTVLLPFNYFFLAIILVVCLRIEYIHQDREFIIQQVVAGVVYILFAFWMSTKMPRTVARAVERLIEKA